MGLTSLWTDFWQNWNDSSAVSALKHKAAKDPAAALEEVGRGLQWGDPSPAIKQAYIDTLKGLVEGNPQKALHAVREAIQGRREADPASRAQLISILSTAVAKPENAAFAVTEAGGLLYSVKDFAPEHRTALLDVLATGAKTAVAETLLHAGQAFAGQASEALTVDDKSKLVAIIKAASESDAEAAVRPASKAYFTVHKRPEERAAVVGIFSDAAGKTADASDEAASLLLSTPNLTDGERDELMAIVRKGLDSADPAVRQAVAEVIVHRVQTDYAYYVAQQGWQPFARDQESVVGIPRLALAFREAVDGGKVDVAALRDHTRKFLRSTQQVGAAFTAMSEGLSIPAPGPRPL